MTSAKTPVKTIVKTRMLTAVEFSAFGRSSVRRSQLVYLLRKLFLLLAGSFDQYRKVIDGFANTRRPSDSQQDVSAREARYRVRDGEPDACP